jgi:hypothetical protein
MRHTLFFMFFASLWLALGACSTTTKSVPVSGDHHTDEMNELEAMSRAAIVVTGSPRLDATKPSTISWVGDLDVTGKHQTLSAEELRQHLTQVVNEQILAKGYSVVPDGGDFQLDGVVVLAGAKDELTLLRESGGLDPGLAGVNDHLGKGTLVLELKQGRVTRWKGTVQIYIAPQFDQAIALRRIEYAVAQLLGTWP